MSKLLIAVFTILSRLPLAVLQAIGSALGWIVYLSSPGYAGRMRQNLAQSGQINNPQHGQKLLRQAIRATGMGAMELLIAWGRPSAAIARLVKNCNHWDIVEEALAQNKGIIFVTPHLGNYDIAGRYLSQRLMQRPQSVALMAMYRPPKLAWLEPLMNAGRVRDGSNTAPATAAGVRMVMKTLKAQQTTIILPDQVPGQGDGVWAPFFGRPAYTMTLVPRLAQMDNVEVILFFGRRLGWGRGFEVVLQRLPEPFSGNKAEDGRRLNQAVESLIRQAPAQYLWSYNRYKTPAGVTPPMEASSS